MTLLERLTLGQAPAAIGAFGIVTAIFCALPGQAHAASITLDLPTTPEDIVTIGVSAFGLGFAMAALVQVLARRAVRRCCPPAPAAPGLTFAGWRKPHTIIPAGEQP